MSGSDKTEAPTPKRKRDARKDGQIARSPDLTGWASMLVASMLVEQAIGGSAQALEQLFTDSGRLMAEPDQQLALGLFGSGLRTAFTATAPLVFGLMLVGLVGNIAQVGWAPTSKLLKPKFSKINPLKGAKRLVSPQSVWMAAKDLLKVALLTSVAYSPVATITATLMASGQPPVEDMVVLVGRAALELTRNAAMAGLVLGMADYAMQKRRIGKQLKMTKQEIRDEYRQSEGDPHVKGQIRARQMSMSRNRMMSEVATADAVLVNPTHIAVAVRYQPELGAPRVVAKGAGVVAQRIREEAERHRVPIVADKPLARTLHKMCDLGMEIPADLYEAIARLLAFVFSLRAAGKVGGVHQQARSLLAS